MRRSQVRHRIAVEALVGNGPSAEAQHLSFNQVAAVRQSREALLHQCGRLIHAAVASAQQHVVTSMHGEDRIDARLRHAKDVHGVQFAIGHAPMALVEIDHVPLGLEEHEHRSRSSCFVASIAARSMASYFEW